MDDITTGLMVLLMLLGVASPIVVICVVHYLKKRLEHKQIMAAIEKGTPLSELVPPKPKPVGPLWIKYLSLGVGVLIMTIPLLVRRSHTPETVIPYVLLGLAAIWMTRGLLYRKYYLKAQSANQNNAPPNDASA